MSDTSAANTIAAAVGMTMGSVLVQECVMDPADPKPPIPGELTVGFPGE